jgi:hypothetical protein
MAPMLSRKEFFKDLLLRGVRAFGDLAAEAEAAPPGVDRQAPDFDPAATELSPALLAIEAECRGINAAGDHAEKLRRALYAELAQNGPDSGVVKP